MLKEASIHIDPKIVAAAVERNPHMLELQTAVRRRFKADEATARRFAERLLTRQVKRVGAEYLDVMASRIQRIFENRERAARIVDQVIGNEKLSPAEAGQRLDRLFKDIKQDMDAIAGPADFAKEANIAPPDDVASELRLAEQENAGKMPAKPLPTGRHVEKVAVLKSKLKALAKAKQAAMRKAGGLLPQELWRAVVSETEMGMERNLAALKAKAAAQGMSAKEIAALEEAVRELSLERARSQRLPGTAAAIRGAEGLKRLSPRLRKLVEGDFVLEPMAAENPKLLEQYLQESGAKSRSALRRYVRNRMVTHVRGMLGEFTVAFDLGEGLTLLKGPDHNVTIPGTDLVGVTRDGRLWLIDNKALSASELESVTSLTRNIAKNMEDDAAAFAPVAAAPAADPRMVDAVNRLTAASKEIRKLTAGMDTDKVGSLDVQKQISAICKKHKIDRVVTNAGGAIDGLSAGLKERGIRFADLNGPPAADVKLE